MKKTLLDIGIQDQKIKVLPNWVNKNQIKFDQEEGKKLRSELGLEGKTVLLYSGTLSAKQGLETLIEAMRLIPAKLNLTLVVCGEGPARSGLVRLAKKFELQNILFIDMQPIEKLSALLSMADVHMVLQKKGLGDLLLPSKLTNILAIGGNLIVAAENDSEIGRLIINTPSIGKLCQPENYEALAEAISSFSSVSLAKPNDKAQQLSDRLFDKQKILRQLKESILQ